MVEQPIQQPKVMKNAPFHAPKRNTLFLNDGMIYKDQVEMSALVTSRNGLKGVEVAHPVLSSQPSGEKQKHFQSYNHSNISHEVQRSVSRGKAVGFSKIN
eukprot:CAMPEP_0202979380 /NCGR_PEP_ID=MMETSP1396-20130829/85548_1 /ASSEMBLY_ACC=CAM_ASM_000872 /TAXON_ID= /ORGANISM="Pseudokeronopsis sp., Strain Brazil" /LENGTH=99 /DNA_ID=CAMNT_0049718783 /DNA_START=248 /DNA_END=550 /DNA_ORIENTATION=+